MKLYWVFPLFRNYLCCITEQEFVSLITLQLENFQISLIKSIVHVGISQI